jgi:hypothetical protein
LQYFPFDSNLNDYSSGTAIAPTSTDTNVSYSTANTKTGTGSVYFGPIPTSSLGIKLKTLTLGLNGITIAMWIKSTTASIATMRLFEFTNGLTPFFTMYLIVGGTLGVSFNGSNSYSTSFVLTDTDWHHYCIVMQPSGTGTFVIYVDGISKYSGTVDNYSNFSNSMPSCLIGGSANTTYAPPLKNAYMNQFLCFNRAITATELSYLVNYPSLLQFSTSATAAPLPYPCFLEGSKILRLDPIGGQESYVPIETLKNGDLIITADSGYKAISFIGRKIIDNKPDSEIKNRLYIMKKQGKMIDDLVLTGEHCTLHSNLSNELIASVKASMGDVFITENYYRVPAHLDERFEPYPVEGPATIWHFALEHDEPEWNYGVFANGLLVESCSIRYMAELKNMELVLHR